MLTLTEFRLRVLVVDADIVFLGDPTKARLSCGRPSLAILQRVRVFVCVCVCARSCDLRR